MLTSILSICLFEKWLGTRDLTILVFHVGSHNIQRIIIDAYQGMERCNQEAGPLRGSGDADPEARGLGAQLQKCSGFEGAPPRRARSGSAAPREAGRLGAQPQG